MTDYTKALELEIALRVEEAAEVYETVIQIADAPVDAFINLACVYWQSTELGFHAGLKLNHKFIRLAGERMWATLDKAQSKYGGYPEIDFWKRYFNFTTLGEPPFVEQCLQLIQQPRATLVPYFHIYDQTKDLKYIPKTKLLYEQVFSERTIKNRYIISILENYASNW